MERNLSRRAAAFTAGCLLSFTVGGAAAGASDLLWGVLPNGLEYVLVESHGHPRVAVSGCFRIGGRTEALHEKGLTHLVEHLIGRGGTRKLSEEAWRSVRSKMGFAGYTGKDGTCYDFQVPADRLADSLGSYSEALFELEITEAKVTAEREVVLQEWLRGLSMPFGPESHRLWPAAFSRHPYRTMTIGLEEVLHAADADLLRKFYSERFRPNHLFLAVVGDFDGRETEESIRTIFGAYPAGAASFELGRREPPQQSYRETLSAGTEDGSRLLLGCKVPGAAHPDATALDVASRVLGHGPSSRLASPLLGRGEALSVTAAPSDTRDPGLFTFQIETSTGREEEALARFWQVLRDLAERGASPHEAERAKRSLEVDRAISRESLIGRARALTAAELAGSHTLDASYRGRLRAVTGADLSRVVTRYLAPGRCSVVATVAFPDHRGWRHLAEASAALWPAAEGDRDTRAKVTRLTLENGAVAIVEERPGSATQAMELWIAGAPWEVPAELAGLGELAAQSLALQPVPGGGTFEDLVAAAGGRLQVRSAPDYVGLAVESLVEDFPRLTASLLQALGSPRVTAELLETARRRVANNIAGENARGESFARSQLLGALFAGHPYGAATTVESLQRIDGGRLGEFLRGTLRANRTIAVLVGGMDLQAAEDLVTRSLGPLPTGEEPRGPGPAPTAPRGPRRRSSHRAVPQSQVATGMSTVGVASDDFLPLQVATRLLWGRLFYTFVRGDEPLAYWLFADLPARVGPSPVYVQAGISPSDEPRLLAGIRAAVQALDSGPIPADELEGAKERLIAGLSPQEVQGEQARLRALYELLLGRGDQLEEIAGRIREVTADDVRRVARERLLSIEWSVSVVGPE